MPEQTTLQGELTVGPLPEGTMAIVIDVGAERSYVIPLPPQTAETVGKALLAPRVHMPTNGNHEGR